MLSRLCKAPPSLLPSHGGGRRRCARALAIVLAAAIVMRPGRIGAVVPVPAARPVEVVVEHLDGSWRVRASMLILAPIAAVWSVLVDYERMPKISPRVESVRVVRRDGNDVVVEQKGTLQWLVFKQAVESTFAIVEDPQRSVVARSLAGSFREFEGKYLLTAVGAAATLFRYEARFVPAFERPSFIVTAAARASAAEDLAAFRRAVEADVAAAAGGAKPPAPP